MLTKKVDKSASKAGLVSNFSKGEGTTGYRIEMLIYGQVATYDCTKAVYDYIDQGRVGVYPNVMELIYIPIFDAQGVVVQLLQADGYENEENCLIDTIFSFATAMRTRPATAETLVTGDFFIIEGSKLIFASDYDAKKDALCYFVREGAMEEPGNNVVHQMADNFDIYTWDWATKGSPEATSAKDVDEMEGYVPGFQLGTIEDVYKCHWIWFGSLCGDDSKLDTICAFMNSKKVK